jgi:hypothetical protein
MVSQINMARELKRRLVSYKEKGARQRSRRSNEAKMLVGGLKENERMK